MTSKIKSQSNTDYNTINYVFSFNSSNLNNSNNSKTELNDKLIALKTLLATDFSITQNIISVDKFNNIETCRKYKLTNYSLETTTDNLFHTYEDTQKFIAYEKMQRQITSLIDTKHYLISLENNTPLEITESYNETEVSRYISYLFLYNDFTQIELRDYFQEQNYFTININIKTNEDITAPKYKFIDKLVKNIKLI